MNKRKIYLLCAIAFFLCVSIIQTVLDLKNPVKTVSFNETPDLITIKGNGLDVELTLDGTTWFVGNYKVSAADSNRILNSLKEIKVLDKVGKLGNPSIEERYELNDSKVEIITAIKDGKILRTLNIGKISSTGSHTYAVIDNSKDIVMLSGNLHSAFDKSAEDLRSKAVYSISPNEIKAISVDRGKDSWGINHSSVDEEISQWQGSGKALAVDIDGSKVSAWFDQLATLNVSEWVEKPENLPSKTVLFTIETQTEAIVVDLYKIPGTEEFMCTSNKTPHVFKITEITAAKFLKKPSELAK